MKMITAKEYKEALQNIKITDKQMLMLQAHYEIVKAIEQLDLFNLKRIN